MKRSELKKLIREVVIEPEDSTTRHEASIERALNSEKAQKMLAEFPFTNKFDYRKDIIKWIKDYLTQESTPQAHKNNIEGVLRCVIDYCEERISQVMSSLDEEEDNIISYIYDFGFDDFEYDEDEEA